MAQSARIATGAGEVPLTVANYPVFDAAGNLYVSNSGGWHQNGRLDLQDRPGGPRRGVEPHLGRFPQWHGNRCDGPSTFTWP